MSLVKGLAMSGAFDHIKVNNEMALKNERLKSENDRLKSDNKLLNGCIEDCEDSIKEFERLESENEKLKACVEFYANIGNWSGFEPHFTESKCIFSPPIDNEYNQDLTGFVSGKLARKTLSELKTNSSESSVIEKE
jgi:hypothetical protein